MQSLHTLSSTTRKKKRLGRGGARGGKCGRGDKGQRSRAGHKIRPAMRDELQRIPKRRGHNKNRARTVRHKPPVRSVTLEMLSRNFKKGDTVTPTTLVQRDLIARTGGSLPSVKVVVRGELLHALVFSGCDFSKTAEQKVRDAGGTIH